MITTISESLPFYCIICQEINCVNVDKFLNVVTAAAIKILKTSSKVKKIPWLDFFILQYHSSNILIWCGLLKLCFLQRALSFCREFHCMSAIGMSNFFISYIIFVKHIEERTVIIIKKKINPPNSGNLSPGTTQGGHHSRNGTHR